MSEINSFQTMREINLKDLVSKKMNLTYLSWPDAVDQLLLIDPTASWTYGEPARWGDTWMVFCTVKAFGIDRTAQLPVMNHSNKAIVNPDSFAVNTAMQRCLVKAIALHGLGLYIYRNEDLPPDSAIQTNNPLDAIQPEETSVSIEWHLMYPNKPEPAKSFATSEEWENEYNALASQISKKQDVTHRERMTKLRELKEANQPILDKLDPVRRSWHSKQYADRRAALGAAMPPEPPKQD